MGIPNHAFIGSSRQTAHRLTSWLSYHPDVISLTIIIRHGQQWETAIEAHHVVPINTPPSPSGLCQPARSPCHYAKTFEWITIKITGSQQRQHAKTGSVTEVEERVNDPLGFYSGLHYK